MIVECITGGLLFTNCYLVVSEKEKVCALIDCAHGSFKAIASYLERHQLTLQSVYLTHTHFDHIGDLKLIKEKFSPQIYVHTNDKQNLLLPGSDKIPLFMKTEGVFADCELVEGQKLFIGSIEVRVIETPGHSPGSVSFFLPQERALFSGDVLFKRGRGRTDLPGCSEEALFDSLEKLFHLGDDVIVYPGHGATTTIGEERD